MSKLAAITSGVRRLRSMGWSEAAIASVYSVTTRTVLAILTPAPRPFVLALKRNPRWRDEWKRDDWRFKDDVGVEPVLIEARVPGSEGISFSAPPIVPEPVKPALTRWTGPASPCQTSLPGGRRRIRD